MTTSNTSPEVLLIGDSRVVGMSGQGNPVDKTVNGVHYFAKVGQGYAWLNSQTSRIQTLAQNSQDVVISIGVNDPYNWSKYEKWLKNMLPIWRAQGKNVYFTSIDPVNSNYRYSSTYGYSEMNRDIQAFNQELKNFCDNNNVHYINTHKFVNDHNLTSQMTSDGLHYNAAAAGRIRDFITTQVQEYVHEHGYPQAQAQTQTQQQQRSPQSAPQQATTRSATQTTTYDAQEDIITTERTNTMTGSNNHSTQDQTNDPLEHLHDLASNHNGFLIKYLRSELGLNIRGEQVGDLENIVREQYAQWSKSSNPNDRMKAVALCAFINLQYNQNTYQGENVKLNKGSDVMTATELHTVDSNIIDKVPTAEFIAYLKSIGLDIGDSHNLLAFVSEGLEGQAWTAEQKSAVRKFIELNCDRSTETIKQPEPTITLAAALSAKQVYDIDAFAESVQNLIGQEMRTFAQETPVQKFQTIYDAYQAKLLRLTQNDEKETLTAQFELCTEALLAKGGLDGEQIQAINAILKPEARTVNNTHQQLATDSQKAFDDWRYIANCTPTYFYAFLRDAPQIAPEHKPSGWMNSKQLNEWLNAQEFSEEEIKAINAYTEAQRAQINRDTWPTIRKSRGEDGQYNVAQTVINTLNTNATDSAEQANAAPAPQNQEAQDQNQSNQPANAAPATQQQPQQQEEPVIPYPHLPHNLITAVQNNPKEMYQYFMRHSKSCGDFKEASVLGDDGQPNSGKMLEFLESRYPYFTESRRHKIDVACRKNSPDTYVYPPFEDVEQRTAAIGYMNKHYKTNLALNADTETVAQAYRKLSGAQRSDFRAKMEEAYKNQDLRLYGHASGGEQYDTENTNNAGKDYPTTEKDNQTNQQTRRKKILGLAIGKRVPVGR